MDIPDLAGVAAGAIVAAALAPKALARFRLSRAKHRSLAGHSRLAKRLARLTPAYDFDSPAPSG